MSILRTEHNKENPYVVLNKSALENRKMSWEAKGLWSFLMSRPDDWNVSVEHLHKSFECAGKKQLYRIINELISFGYCRKVQPKNDQRMFSNIEYIIIEKPENSPHVESGPLGQKGSPVSVPVKTGKHPENSPHVESGPLGRFGRARNGRAQNEPLTINNDNNDKEDIYIKNDIPVGKQCESSDLPFSHTHKFTVFDPHTYILRNGEKLQIRTVRAFSKYTGKERERLQANVFWYEEYVDSGKTVKRSHEALLQYAVSNDMAAKESIVFQNSLYAKMMIIEKGLVNVKIMKTVIHLEGESISLNLPTKTFSEIIDNFIKKRK